MELHVLKYNTELVPLQIYCSITLYHQLTLTFDFVYVMLKRDPVNPLSQVSFFKRVFCHLRIEEFHIKSRYLFFLKVRGPFIETSYTLPAPKSHS